MGRGEHEFSEGPSRSILVSSLSGDEPDSCSRSDVYTVVSDAKRRKPP
jgi:hypothetical protein